MKRQFNIALSKSSQGATSIVLTRILLSHFMTA